MPSMAITWAQRLKRVFGIDIETCPACGGALRIIACIEDPAAGRTGLDVDAEDAFEALRPGHCGPALRRCVLLFLL